MRTERVRIECIYQYRFSTLTCVYTLRINPPNCFLINLLVYLGVPFLLRKTSYDRKSCTDNSITKYPQS